MSRDLRTVGDRARRKGAYCGTADKIQLDEGDTPLNYAYHVAPFNEVICMLMISVDDVMKILKDYMVCDGLYREVDDIEIRCKLNQSAHEVKAYTEEEWYE